MELNWRLNGIGVSVVGCDEHYFLYAYSDYMKVCLTEILSKKNVSYLDYETLGNTKRYFLKMLTIKLLVSNVLKCNTLTKFFSSIIINMIPFNIKKDTSKNIHIFYEGNPLSNNLFFIKYIKQLQPNGKIVFIYTNSMKHTKTSRLKNILFGDYCRRLSLQKRSNLYDLILTYDEKDSINCDIGYHELVNSRIDYVLSNNIDSDVYFCGLDKGRGNEIGEIYKFLSLNGFKCNFNIAKPDKNTIKIDGIKYRKKMLSYVDTLVDMNKSKCILEITFSATTGATLRVSEAILYDKKLLTSNQAMLCNELYNKDQMLIFKNVEDIDLDFLRKDMNEGVCFGSNIISPNNLLEYIHSNVT